MPWTWHAIVQVGCRASPVTQLNVSQTMCQDVRWRYTTWDEITPCGSKWGEDEAREMSCITSCEMLSRHVIGFILWCKQESSNHVRWGHIMWRYVRRWHITWDEPRHTTWDDVTSCDRTWCGMAPRMMSHVRWRQTTSSHLRWRHSCHVDRKR